MYYNATNVRGVEGEGLSGAERLRGERDCQKGKGFLGSAASVLQVRRYFFLPTIIDEMSECTGPI